MVSLDTKCQFFDLFMTYYVVFKGFVFDPTDYTTQYPLTDEYMERALVVLQAHMMLGAARLAALIEELYADSTTTATIKFDDSTPE